MFLKKARMPPKQQTQIEEPSSKSIPGRIYINRPRPISKPAQFRGSEEEWVSFWYTQICPSFNEIYSEMAHLLGVAQSVTRKISHRSRGFQPRE